MCFICYMNTDDEVKWLSKNITLGRFAEIVSSGCPLFVIERSCDETINYELTEKGWNVNNGNDAGINA